MFNPCHQTDAAQEGAIGFLLRTLLRGRQAEELGGGARRESQSVGVVEDFEGRLHWSPGTIELGACDDAETGGVQGPG